MMADKQPVSRPLPGYAERARLADQNWPIVLGVVAAAAAIPWYLGWLAADLSTLLWTLLVLGASYSVANFAGAAFVTADRLPGFHAALHMLATALLGLVWHQAGALDAPLFVVVFALPIASAALISRGWLHIGVALTAIAAIWTTATLNSTELRWQLAQGGFPAFWEMLPFPLDDQSFPRTGRAVLHMQHLLIASFGLLGTALVAGSGTGLVARLYQRLGASTAEGRRLGQLATAFISQRSAMELIVVRGTGEIIAVTDELLRAVRQVPANVSGHRLGSVLRFSSYEDIERLLQSGRSGELLRHVLELPGETRIVNISVEPFRLGEEEVAKVTMRSLSPSDYAALAIDAVDLPVAVIDADGRLAWANRALAAVAPAFTAGRWVEEISTALSLPSGWWDISPRELHTRPLAVGNARYKAVIRRVSVFRAEPLTVVHLEKWDES